MDSALTKRIYKLRCRAEYPVRTYPVDQRQSDSQTQLKEKRLKIAETSGFKQSNEVKRDLAVYNALKEGISKAHSFFALLSNCNVARKERLQPQVEDFAEAKLLSLRSCLDDYIEVKPFSYELEAMIQEDFVEPVIQNFLAETSDEECVEKGLASHNFWGERASLFARLKSLSVLMTSGRSIEVPGNAESLFTSIMINRGVDLELGILRALTEEIGRATTHEQQLRQLKKDLVSTSTSVAKLRTDVMELQQKFLTKPRSVRDAKTSSRLGMLKSIRYSDEEITGLTKVLSLAVTEIVEQVYKDALQERDLQHARAKENQDQQHAREKESHDLKLETAIAKLAEQKSKVAFLSTELKVHKEATSNEPECCICYRELEGYSTGQDASSSTRKVVHKRACFLPCMHANVCKACSEKRWSEGPRVCPMCRHKLTSKPRLIYL